VPVAVLDSSAVLALLLKEPGSEAVAPYVGTGVVSVVNYSEIVARLSEQGARAEFIEAQIDTLSLMIAPFDRATALASGLLRPATREFGLSFADRACLATAAQLDMPAVTADRAWADINIGVRIELIR
jgi:ribonuclease VapC